MATRFVCAAVLATFLAATQAESGKIITISNKEPKRDISGSLMDVHDGQINEWAAHSGLLFWYGMGYGNCSERFSPLPPKNCGGLYLPFGRGCGFKETHTVNLYTSPDLVNWTFQGNVLPVESRPQGIYFRPKIIFNKDDSTYVLWINRLPPASTPLKSYPQASYTVAISKSPFGPFTVANQHAATAVPGGGDFALMVTADGAGYIAYDAWDNSHTVTVEKLTPDYLDSLGANSSSGPISPHNHEAPILFQRAGWVYLLFGHTCCFCSEGAGSSVFVAKHPLGPYTNTGIDINPRHDMIGPHAIKAQENYVFTVREGNTTTYVYTGDRWDSAPDHVKGHDLQYWQPLQFESATDTHAEAPLIRPLEWVDEFSLTLDLLN